MGKIWVFGGLFISYVLYSLLVYTKGTENRIAVTPEVQQGKLLYQKYNCASCHQLYGLGGYLGPELTTAWSDSNRGEAFMRAFLQGGGRRMPNFKFSGTEINDILQYLRYVDATPAGKSPSP